MDSATTNHMENISVHTKRRQVNHQKKEFFFLAEFSLEKICSCIFKDVYQLLIDDSSPTLDAARIEKN